MNAKTILCITLSALLFTACKDSKSYSELLDEEQKAVNSFLANQRIVNEIPADTVFTTVEEAGDDAPFYRIDEEGNVYMQVVRPGDRKNNRAKTDQVIYFRYARMNLMDYEQGVDDSFVGNSAVMGDATATTEASFRFDNYSLESTSQYGYGIQMPLHFLGIDCEVNVLIKSQYGFYGEVSNVQPYLFRIRYFPSKI